MCSSQPITALPEHRVGASPRRQWEHNGGPGAGENAVNLNDNKIKVTQRTKLLYKYVAREFKFPIYISGSLIMLKGAFIFLHQFYLARVL